MGDADERIEKAIAAIELAHLALDAIANKRRICADRIEPVRTINDAGKIAKAAISHLERAVIALTPMGPVISDSGSGCQAGRDGECISKQCPQLRDGEPRATGRHCPLDNA